MSQRSKTVYGFDAYGKQKITDASGNVTRAKSSVGWDRSFTGYITDNETGLLHARTRQYSPTLGRFLGRDPKIYIDGFSQYDRYDIANSIDWSGTEKVTLLVPKDGWGWGKTIQKIEVGLCRPCKDDDKCWEYGPITHNPTTEVLTKFIILLTPSNQEWECDIPAKDIKETQDHEDAHVNNAKRFVEAVNAHWQPFGKFKSQDSCRDERGYVVQAFNDWGRREKNHSNPGSPPSADGTGFSNDLVHRAWNTPGSCRRLR